MLYDYESILIDHGFTPDQYNLKSAITAIKYDIEFALFGANSPFDRSCSRVIQQPDNPNAYIRVELSTNNNDVDAGLQYFYQQWSDEIRQTNLIRETIEVRRLDHRLITIRILAIYEHKAITVLLNIT